MKLIFNSSIPKSGSEIFQCILSQNPNIYGSSTSPLLEYQFAARSNFNLPEVQSQDKELMTKAFIKMCKGMAESYYSEITDKDVVVDKNRGWSHYYEWVEQWNPNPKMVCMVRDIRAILWSMEKTYRANRHRPEGPDNPAEIKNMTFEDRIVYWLNTQPIGLALRRSLDFHQRKLSEKILHVKYEDLCNDPEAQLKRFYSYAELDYYKHDFSNIEKKVKEDDSYFGVYGAHSIKKKISKENINEWKGNITKNISEYIVNNNKWFYDMFEYEE